MGLWAQNCHVCNIYTECILLYILVYRHQCSYFCFRTLVRQFSRLALRFLCLADSIKDFWGAFVDSFWMQRMGLLVVGQIAHASLITRISNETWFNIRKRLINWTYILLHFLFEHCKDKGVYHKRVLNPYFMTFQWL